MSRVSTGKVKLKKSGQDQLSFTVPKMFNQDLDKFVGIEYVCIVNDGAVMFQPLDKPRTFRII